MTLEMTTFRLPKKTTLQTEERLERDQTSIKLVQCIKDFQENQSEFQEITADTTANHSGDNNMPRPRFTAAQVEDRFLKNEIRVKFCMPLSFTLVLKWKKEMLYVPVDFKNGLTKDVLVEPGTYVTAIVQNVLDRIKQQAPTKKFRIDKPPNIEIQIANGQLEKEIATATPNFDFRDTAFAKHIVVMKH